MVMRPARQQVADRDLRTLSTADLLSLIQDDIKELDSLISLRRRAAKEQKPGGKHKTARAALDALAEPEEPEPESPPLHAVTCCNHHMGDFPPWARVRCPFCQEWHRAGDFPTAS